MNVWFYRTEAGNGIVFASNEHEAEARAAHIVNGMDPNPGEVIEVLPTWEDAASLVDDWAQMSAA